ncbi:phosphopantetheine-binding protein, partial [Xanthomonas arboricola]|uniref:phosphopantetheine-binding protein n=1 Tax=Xanthomonas arboricola TaxID=56448 RepID=UPI0013799979
IGIHDNFFELGGHSLLAARLASRVAAQLQRQVPVSAVFSHPSIVRMAGYLEQADAEDTTPIAVVDRSRPLPPSLAQRRLWFLSQLDGAAGAAYHMPVSLRL